MSEQDTTPSITEVAHDRDGDGELMAVTEDVEIHGQEYEAEIYPATTGQRNEWTQRLEGEDEELSDELTAELLDEFATHEPEDFGADSWDDVRPAVTDALGNAILAKMFDAEDTDEFVEALEEAAQGATEGNQD
ncbi:hypothetical protein SAMN06269185_3279 [Natronoarchaeum philippinense]|uniref:Uncharacterized protein n=1 Tax=Natronoarchaeum philippinense TaxID=558529 RepID=A0A285P8V9_NATPI|nr:hypothetical protein [Natronoarchaeum philippinense]SNZ18175.1 hypothetical protein SAMN06269185_3279 [Natronoarchaeum philippinense]